MATKKPARGGTLSVDVGGTGIKGMVLDGKGEPSCERVRLKTPRPAQPAKVIATIIEVAKQMPPYDRVSVGFPGVVVDGVVRTAPNLDGKWDGVDLASDLAKALGKPVRVANDADVQGLGVVEGKGVEMVITLGTGFGSGLYLDGRLVPNLELGHHPLRGKRSYEDYVGKRAFKKLDIEDWSDRVRRIIAQIFPIWNVRKLYIGGGNAKEIKGKLPKNVEVISNIEGILGGIRLWER